MKKEWVRPLTEVQSFVANEYVAGCGDSGTVYKFQCNAPAGTLYYYPTNDGTIDGVYNGSGSAKILGAFHPNESVTHTAPSTSSFYDGFIDYNKNKKHDEGEGVIVWIEKKGWWGSDYHATKELDMSKWETQKS